jgi:hypothetical protein
VRRCASTCRAPKPASPSYERYVPGHVESLAEVGDQANGAVERLEAVIGAHALIARKYHDTELSYATVGYGAMAVSRPP